MGQPIDIEQKDKSHPFMTMILASVTMVGWADVPGDFRHWRAVNISSFLQWYTEDAPQLTHEGEVWSIFCELTHYGLVMPYDLDLVNISSGNGFLPDSTKPLPQPMLTYNQWGSLAFT